MSVNREEYILVALREVQNMSVKREEYFLVALSEVQRYVCKQRRVYSGSP